MFRDDNGGDTDRGFTSPDSRDQRLSGPGPSPISVSVSEAPPQNVSLETLKASETDRTLSSSPPSKEHVDFCRATQGPNMVPKPKLWSLAEIATSSDKNKECSGAGRPLFSHSPALPRHIYYSSPFIPGSSAYGPLGPLHGSAGSRLNGLQQKMLQRVEAVARDCRLRSQSQLEQHEFKRGMTNV